MFTFLNTCIWMELDLVSLIKISNSNFVNGKNMIERKNSKVLNWAFIPSIQHIALATQNSHHMFHSFLGLFSYCSCHGSSYVLYWVLCFHLVMGLDLVVVMDLGFDVHITTILRRVRNRHSIAYVILWHPFLGRVQNRRKLSQMTDLERLNSSSD